jgi:hypothetical protein
MDWSQAAKAKLIDELMLRGHEPMAERFEDTIGIWKISYCDGGVW